MATTPGRAPFDETPTETLLAVVRAAEIRKNVCLSDRMEQGGMITLFFPGASTEQTRVYQLILEEALSSRDRLREETRKQRDHFEEMRTTPEELVELRRIRDAIIFLKGLFK